MTKPSSNPISSSIQGDTRDIKEDRHLRYVCSIAWVQRREPVCTFADVWNIFAKSAWKKKENKCIKIVALSVLDPSCNTCMVSYFSRIDHCCRVGLRVVAARPSSRLVTSDQLQKNKTFTDKSAIRSKLLWFHLKYHSNSFVPVWRCKKAGRFYSFWREPLSGHTNSAWPHLSIIWVGTQSDKPPSQKKKKITTALKLLENIQFFVYT